MQTRIHARTVSGLTLCGDIKSLIKELHRASVSLLLILSLKRIRHLKKGIKATALADDQITHVRRKGRHKMQGVESLGQNLIKSQQCRRIISLQERIHKRETVFIIQNIQIAEYILIFHICSAECYGLVKDCEGITHRSVRLIGYHMKRLVINRDVLVLSNHPKVPHNVLYRDSVEVIGLTTRQDSRKNLVFLSRSKNEDCMCRRFLKGLQEGIERCLREHVDLIDDIHAVFSNLWRYAHLLHQGLDILYAIV